MTTLTDVTLADLELFRHGAPWATFAEHDGVRARPPVSTTHMRQTPSGVRVDP